MLSEGFGFYSQDDGESLKDLELGSELAGLIFWNDLYIARSRADGWWPRAALCDTIFKRFKRFFVLQSLLRITQCKEEQCLQQAELVQCNFYQAPAGQPWAHYLPKAKLSLFFFYTVKRTTLSP